MACHYDFRDQEEVNYRTLRNAPTLEFGACRLLAVFELIDHAMLRCERHPLFVESDELLSFATLSSAELSCYPARALSSLPGVQVS
jgi:hypothetical protein